MGLHHRALLRVVTVKQSPEKCFAAETKNERRFGSSYLSGRCGNVHQADCVCVCVKITHGLKEDVKRSEEERARFVGTMRLTRGEVFGLSGKQRPNP